MNTLYYGDNIHVLRTHVPDESVDLVYLDPPFNSGRDYNAVFEDGEANGKRASAQVKAFVDTWRWDDAAHAAYEEVVQDTSGEPMRLKLADTLRAFRVVLGTGSTLAYLAMMAPRLVELRRVLRATGSLYLHCFPADTLVRKGDGRSVPITEIVKGDVVVSDCGETGEVAETLTRDYTGDVIVVRPLGSPESLISTPNHKVYVLPKEDVSRYRAWVRKTDRTRRGVTGFKTRRPWLGEDVYVARITPRPSGELRVGDCCLLPIDRTIIPIAGFPVVRSAHPNAISVPPKIPCTEQSARLFGFYLAEGNVNKGYYTQFTLHEREQDIAEEIKATVKDLFGLDASIDPVEGRKAIRVTVSSVNFASFFEGMFGTGSHNKHIPRALQVAPLDIQRALFTTWAIGDGHHRDRHRSTHERLTGSTVSLDLAQQMQQIALRLGAVATIGIGDLPEYQTEVNASTCYRVQVNAADLPLVGFIPKHARLAGAPAPLRRCFILGDYLCLPIRTVETRPHSGPVFNLHIEPKHSYCASGVKVSNCDPTASHYLKMLLDAVFGRENFRNEIVWKRTSAHNDPGRFGNVHDVLLFYGKSARGTWNTVYQPYDESYIKSHYGQADPDGRRFRLSDLTGPGVSNGPSGQPWRGADPTRIGRHWSVPKYLRASLGIPADATPQEALDILDAAGRIIWPKNGGMPAFKRYLDEMPGLPCQDTWTDIPPLNSQAAERLGYPTQKPRALLERIIRASSNPGDVVLDPFCVTGDTRIVTSTGLRPISDIQVGDSVLTHEGRFRLVVKTYKNPHDGPLLTIRRAKSTVPLRVTPNHALLTVRAEPCPYDDRRCLPRTCKHHRANKHKDCPHPSVRYVPTWVPANEVKPGDFVYIPNTMSPAVLPPSEFVLPLRGHHNEKKVPATLPMSEDLMEWVGWYASEGFIDENTTHFANFEDAQRIAEITARLFGHDATIRVTQERGRNINFASRPVSAWISGLVGKLAPNKKLPEWVFGLTPSLRRALLRGLFRGDGSFRKDRPNDKSCSYKYSSASPTLGHQVLRLVAQEGCVASYRVYMPKDGKIGEQVVHANHPCHEVQVFNHTGVTALLRATGEAPEYEEDFVRQPYDGYPFKDGFLYSIKSVESGTFTGDVFNLEVEEDHSYVTESFTTHNCGCGTALDAAVVLGRKWVGIDVTHLAVNVIKKRLEDVHNLHPGKDYQVVGEPADLAGAEQLAKDDPHQFQTWALGLVGARTEAGPAKKGSDRGIDGVKVFGTRGNDTTRCLISVKGGVVSPSMVRDLRGTIEREKAAMGLLISLKAPTKGMRDEAREAGLYEPEGLDAIFGDAIPRIQVLSVEELLAGKKPVFPAGVSTQDKTIKRGKRQGS